MSHIKSQSTNQSIKLALTLTFGIQLATASLAPLTAFAADKDKAKSTSPDGPKANSLETVGDEAERLNIEAIKQKYWARGNEEELGVVQNRMFTKEKKFELGLYGGFVSSDPFLSVYSASFSLGYHFNEYFSFAVYAMKEFVGPSSALTLFREPYPRGAGAQASTNEPRWYVGGEAMASLLYGKLSLIGKAIIHYDFHFIAGGGVTSTENGRYFTPHVGVGQQFFLTRWMTLRFDYRLMYYNETIIQKNEGPAKGSVVGPRDNWSNTITLGVSFLWSPFIKKAPSEETSSESQRK